MKELAMATLVAGGVCTADATSASLPLTQEWDKVFPKSDKVEHAKVTFRNRFGIMLAADVYKPKVGNEKFAAIAVSGPFGAVKEQSSGLYAQTLAERGFLLSRASRVAHLATSLRLTSTRRIFRQRLTISSRAMTLTPTRSASSASADGADLPSTLRRLIPASRRRSPRPCTT